MTDRTAVTSDHEGLVTHNEYQYQNKRRGTAGWMILQEDAGEDATDQKQPQAKEEIDAERVKAPP